MNTPRKSWERQPNESARAFEHARCYFRMGANRSIAAVSQEVAKGVPFLKRLSTRHNWVIRAEDYDLHQRELQQEAERQALLTEADKWAKRRAAIWEEMFLYGEQLVAKAKEILRFPTEQQEFERDEEGRVIRVVITPINYAPVDVWRFISLGMRMQAMAVGIVDGSSPLDDADLSSMSNEELKRWAQLAETGQRPGGKLSL